MQVLPVRLSAAGSPYEFKLKMGWFIGAFHTMKIITESYLEAITRLPKEGQYILAHQQDEQIVVYQAYNEKIADDAVKHQALGGTHFSYNRMSWIKPNFLWMMYRCGWASKENQERVLAIWLDKADFESILRQAVFSTFNSDHYDSQEHWKAELSRKEVRLQWDPDHDPYGGKLVRRAIQIGMKGNMLENYGKRQIRLIEDITRFVKEQQVHIDHGNLQQLQVPVETILQLSDASLHKQIGAE